MSFGSGWYGGGGGIFGEGSALGGGVVLSAMVTSDGNAYPQRNRTEPEGQDGTLQ